MALPPRIGVHDADTGETLDAALTVTARKRQMHYPEGWLSMSQAALRTIAEDRSLTLADHRVLATLLSRVGFENVVVVNQSMLAEGLNLHRTQVSRSLAKLVERNYLIAGEKDGRHRSYALNPFVGWKGSTQKGNGALARARSQGFALIEGGRSDDG